MAGGEYERFPGGGGEGCGGALVFLSDITCFCFWVLKAVEGTLELEVCMTNVVVIHLTNYGAF